MITVKLGEIRSIVEGLNEILEKDIPVKPSYWFGKLATKIQAEAKEYNNTRMKLVEKYGKRDEDGKLAVVDNKYQFDNDEGFDKEFSELSNTEVEIDVGKDIFPMKLDSLGDIEIKPTALMALEKFIEV